MKAIWFLPLATIGLCQLPGALLQEAMNDQGQPGNAAGAPAGNNLNAGGQDGAAAEAPEDNLPELVDVVPPAIPDEPTPPNPLVVAPVAAIPAPLTAVAAVANSRVYVHEISKFKVAAIEGNVNGKIELVKHLRSVIGNGFIMNGADKWTALIEAEVEGKTDYDNALATYVGDGSEANGRTLYPLQDTYVTNLLNKQAEYTKWVKHVLNLGYSWSKKSFNEMVRVTLHHTFKQYGEILSGLYKVLSASCKSLARPGDVDASRTTIHTALTHAIEYTEFTSKPIGSVAQLVTVFLKHSSMKIEYNNAIAAAKTIITAINLFLNAQPAPERVLATVLTDLAAVEALNDFMSLLPSRDPLVQLTANNWLEDGARIGYIASVSFLRIGQMCQANVNGLMATAVNVNVDQFPKAMNHLVKGVIEYIEKGTDYIDNVALPQNTTNFAEKTTAYVESTNRFFIEYVRAIRMLSGSLEGDAKVAAEVMTLKADAALLNMVATAAFRILRFYGNRLPPTSTGDINPIFTSAMARISQNLEVSTYAYNLSQAASDVDSKERLMTLVSVLHTAVTSSIEELKSFEPTARTLYTQPPSTTAHTAVIEMLSTALEGLAHKVFVPEGSQDGISNDPWTPHSGGKSGMHGASSGANIALPSSLLLGASLLLLA
ncbi:hypothetical protein BBOV_I002220 [Babesia bovis T2Bo]|uniref:Uncharacterized protein n=1 Tax=Babesia bovis TaxID=5865 RepID=A7AW76_BABBO|nr:hypothetical protein BBOV_I002220 [Babesia bovis T2Bo]EDO05304.1 hypothetical protein BBOV_I002220 [Babesia bovis T2Bo]|eukprot:XP_001608872.1 hypothetical protein [Babesia bovis T2Bo]